MSEGVFIGGNMRKVKILADSTVDLNKELIERYNIEIMPLAVHLGDKEYRDGVDIVPEDICKYVSETGQLPKTSAPSVYDFEALFKTWLDRDYDIVYTGIGSKMSAAYMSAKLAADTVCPERIHVVDSLNLSTGTGLLVCKAGDMMLAGASADEIKEEMVRLVPRVRASFVVDTVEYLYKGGRCTTLESFAAGILKLRPRLVVKDGVTVSDQKYRGNFEKCLMGYIKDTIAGMQDIDTTRVFITNAITPGSDLMDRDYGVALEELKKSVQPKEVCYTHAGNVVFSHCGPRTLGILYIKQ